MRKELAVIGRRTCAGLAVASAGLHAVMLGHASAAAGLLLVVMIGACLYCARELWQDGTARAWVVVALMNLAMIALHLPAPTHQHGATGAVEQPSTVMTVATMLALTEVLAATAVLYVYSRRLGEFSARTGIAEA
ncbi:MAG: hypothetical protein M3Y83_10155 [Actinomycetota bacterium]|nr:hypothetical protein [Actinomycetota bacterium]